MIIIISIQADGRFWQEPEPSQTTGMALAHCILGSFLGVGCHCFPPPLDVPTFASRCLHVQATWDTSLSERRNYGREMAGQFCLWFRLPRKPRVLWNAVQIWDREMALLPPQGVTLDMVSEFTQWQQNVQDVILMKIAMQHRIADVQWQQQHFNQLISLSF